MRRYRSVKYSWKEKRGKGSGNGMWNTVGKMSGNGIVNRIMSMGKYPESTVEGEVRRRIVESQ